MYAWMVSFFNIVRMNQINMTGNILDTAVNIYIILVFAYTTVKIEIKLFMEVTFISIKVHVEKFYLFIVSGVNSCAFRESYTFFCETYRSLCFIDILSGVFWESNNTLMTKNLFHKLSDGCGRRRLISSYEMLCLLNGILKIGYLIKVMM